MNIYEQFGRLMENYNDEGLQTRKSITLIGRIKSGDVAIENIVMTEDGWKIVEVPEDPKETAGTIGPVAGKGS